MTGKDHKMPRAECPCCGHEMNGASGISANEKPRPEDIAVCIKCGAINQYDENFQLKLVPDASFRQGKVWDEARKARRTVRRVQGLPT